MRGLRQMVTARIHAAALPRHGVLRWRDLVGLGLSRDAVRNRVARGELVAIGRGRYIVVSAVDRWTSVRIAQTARESLAVTHHLAAVLYGWDGFPGAPDWMYDHAPLVCPWTSRADLRPYRRRDLSQADLTTINGIRVTRPAWTLATLEEGPRVSRDRLEQAVESALRNRHVTEADLARRARGLLLDVLRLRGEGTPPTGSLLETLTLQRVFRPFGLHVVARQVEVFDAGGRIGRPDFLLDGWVLVEVDGGQHELDGHRHADKVQDLRLHSHGFQVARPTADRITAPGAAPVLAAQLHAMIDHGRRSHHDLPPALRRGRIYAASDGAWVTNASQSEA